VVLGNGLSFWDSRSRVGGAWRALRRFWESDPGLSVFLGLLILMLFVLEPLVEPVGSRRSYVLDVGFSALLLAGVAALSARPVVRAALFAVVVVATAVRWGHFSTQASAAAGLASVAAMAFVVLAQTFRAGPVNVHRIQGAVAAYLLLGLAWALAYELVALRATGAFSGTGPTGPGRHPFIYFSFVTLTTVGYGDVTPVHPVARSLAVTEALVGQLYPAILLARLVSLATGSGPSGPAAGRAG
jgi:Ion channel